MDLDFEKKYYTLEEKHWWSVARREIIFFLLERTSKSAAILEIGCTGGALLRFLTEQGFQNLYGLDTSPYAIETCKIKGLQNVKVGQGENTGYKSDQFEAVIVSDALEHIQNDAQAIQEWHRILKKGGTLIVFVPAFMFLWSSHDIINHHFRRYSKIELKHLIESTRLQIVRISYWNLLLFFPTLAFRILQRILMPNSNHDQFVFLGNFLNWILIHYLKVENFTLKSGANFPFGVSLFCIAKKS